MTVLELDEQDEKAYFQALSSCVVFRTSDRLLVFSGADHLEWLQGQICQDIRRASEDQPLLTAIASPTGHIQGFGQIFRRGETTHIISDVTTTNVLETRAEKMILLEDVRVQVAAEPLWTRQGPLASCDGEGYRHDRFGSGGWDTLEPSEEEAQLTPRAYDLLRLEAGWPVSGLDPAPPALVPELGEEWASQAVSLEKGCYSGQEILMRIHSRGHVNRLRVFLQLKEFPPKTDEVRSASGDKLGVVHQVGLSPRFGPIASATLQRDAVKLRKPVFVGNISATLDELPPAAAFQG